MYIFNLSLSHTHTCACVHVHMRAYACTRVRGLVCMPTCMHTLHKRVKDWLPDLNVNNTATHHFLAFLANNLLNNRMPVNNQTKQTATMKDLNKNQNMHTKTWGALILKCWSMAIVPTNLHFNIRTNAEQDPASLLRGSFCPSKWSAPN